MATYTSNYQLHQWVPEDDFPQNRLQHGFSEDRRGAGGAGGGQGRPVQPGGPAVRHFQCPEHRQRPGPGHSGQLHGQRGRDPLHLRGGQPKGRYPVLGQQQRYGPERRRGGAHHHRHLQRLPHRRRHYERQRHGLHLSGHRVRNGKTPGQGPGVFVCLDRWGDRISGRPAVPVMVSSTFSVTVQSGPV